MSRFRKLFENILGPLFIRIADSPAIAPFGSLRTVSPLSLINAKFEYSTNTHDWPEELTATGIVTHLPRESSNLLSVPAIGDKVYKQSKAYAQYQPGNGQKMNATAVFGPIEEGIKKTVMYGNKVERIYFETDENGINYLGINRIDPDTGLTEELSRIPQSEWNEDNFSNGTKEKNPSGFDFDFTKGLILILDLEWLGMGRVRVGFQIDGYPWYAHLFNHAGIVESVYLSTGSLPIAYEIENISNALGGSFKQSCSTVQSEGGQEIFGVPNMAIRPIASLVTMGTSFKPIVSIRPKEIFGTKDFRGYIRPVRIDLVVTGGGATFVEWGLFHDAVLTTSVWNTISTPGGIPSTTEFDVAAATMSGGHQRDGGYASGTVKGEASSKEDITTIINLYNGINAADRDEADVITLAAKSLGTEDVTGMIRVVEVY